MNTTTLQTLSLFSVTVDNIDYKELKVYKSILSSVQGKLDGEDWEAMEGILNLLDYIADQIEDGKSDPPMQFCRVRMDYLENKLGVPVGNDFYYGSKPLPYYMDNDGKDLFVFHEKEWKHANVVDFDFEF